MILMTTFLAFIVGFWNRPPKLKTRRTGRCDCNPWCIENHMECLLNSEVWNSILILSCLSALLPVAESHATQALRDLQKALEEMEHLFNKSEAQLYTPNIENISGCTYKFFDCFLMEMNVILHEEEPTNNNKLKIETTLEEYNNIECRRQEYYCELQELTNSTVFFKRMKTFLEMQMSCTPQQNITCD